MAGMSTSVVRKPPIFNALFPVLMGPTGSGKSTVKSTSQSFILKTDTPQFIDYATSQGGSSIGHNLSSGTAEIKAVRYTHPGDNRPVIFVDTPGFDEARLPDSDLLHQISYWLIKV
ncbi:hypothetical protein HWV62_32850 [Athelia sp. TMB]|nr:hypothetical protein HWV62_32850 [Athelia sp. TMB]